MCAREPCSYELRSAPCRGLTSASQAARSWYTLQMLTAHPGGTTYTTYQFTSQRNETALGLYFYNARWYDPSLGRFTSADTLVPGGVQGYDRYAYTSNNPVRYTDPTGHRLDDGCSGESGGCTLSQRQKEIDAQNQAMAEAERDKYRCAAGNANYCSGWSNSISRPIIGLHAGGVSTMDVGYGGYAYEQTDYVFDFKSGTIYRMVTAGEGTYLGVPNGAALEGYVGITNVHGIPSSATPDQVADMLSGPNRDIATDVGVELLSDVETSVGKGLSVDLDPDTGAPIVTSAGLMYTTETKIGAGVSLLSLPVDAGGQGGYSQTTAEIYYQLPYWPFR